MECPLNCGTLATIAREEVSVYLSENHIHLTVPSSMPMAFQWHFGLPTFSKFWDNLVHCVIEISVHADGSNVLVIDVPLVFLTRSLLTGG